MIDEREKPLSESAPAIAEQIFVVAAGTVEDVRIDSSASATFDVRVEAGGVLTMIVAGDVRADVSIARRVILAGVGAKATLLAACSIASGVTFRCDDDVRVSASGAECIIDDRCVAGEGSLSIVRQRVVVDPSIIDADVRTSVRGMLLGDGARIRAIPELHIASNAVRAKHAVAISRPTPTMTAYFASRGIGADRARVMLAEQLLCPIGTESLSI